MFIIYWSSRSSYVSKSLYSRGGERVETLEPEIIGGGGIPEVLGVAVILVIGEGGEASGVLEVVVILVGDGGVLGVAVILAVVVVGVAVILLLGVLGIVVVVVVVVVVEEEVEKGKEGESVLEPDSFSFLQLHSPIT